MKNRILTVGFVLLMACGPLYYTFRILDPFIRMNAPRVSAPGFGSDLYPRWAGIRAALFNHENPYSQATTDRIQAGYYGHVVGTDEHRDPQRFAYPAHVAVLLAPLALLDFETARALFLAILILTTTLTSLMWLRIEQPPNAKAISLSMATVLIIASWPVVQGVYAQQITLLVAGLLAGAFYCVWRKRLGVAGLLLAFSTIKPQLSWLSVVWLLVWSLSGRKRHILTCWFGASMILLLGASELLVPGWPLDWLSTFHDYMGYTGSRLNFQVLFGSLAGVLIALVVGMFCGLVLWRTRSSESTSELFAFTVAFISALTLCVLPTWSWATYNQVLLIPAVIYLCRRWRSVMTARIEVRLSYGITILALGWGYLATLYLTSAHLLGTVISDESQLRLPMYNFFLVAPLTLVSLYLLRPVS
jgi:hypothetical protein